MSSAGPALLLHRAPFPTPPRIHRRPNPLAGAAVCRPRAISCSAVSLLQREPAVNVVGKGTASANASRGSAAARCERTLITPSRGRRCYDGERRQMPTCAGGAPSRGQRCYVGAWCCCERRCYHGPSELLPRDIGGATTGHRRRYHGPSAALPRAICSATTGHRQRYHAPSAVLPWAMGVATCGHRWWPGATMHHRRCYHALKALLQATTMAKSRRDSSATAMAHGGGTPACKGC
jgi:hypothetical protein